MLAWTPGAARFGLDTDDVPIFPGMDEAARAIVGGTLEAARMVADGEAEIVCAGDTTLGSGPDVAPGIVNLVGPFECATGDFGDSMRCENMLTGNGFELSADSYETF